MLAATLVAVCAPAGVRARTQTQQFFEQRLLADKQTSKEIKDLLRSGGGFVDKGVVFRDVTGDKRDDAVVRVHSGGVNGVVAVYVFSTANKKGGKLRRDLPHPGASRARRRASLEGVVSLPHRALRAGRRALLPVAPSTPVDARAATRHEHRMRVEGARDLRRRRRRRRRRPRPRRPSIRS